MLYDVMLRNNSDGSLIRFQLDQYLTYGGARRHLARIPGYTVVLCELAPAKQVDYTDFIKRVKLAPVVRISDVREADLQEWAEMESKRHSHGLAGC